MTAKNQAFDRQLITQLGNSCLTIAYQAGACAELQEALALANQRIAELEAKYEPKTPAKAAAKPRKRKP